MVLFDRYQRRIADVERILRHAYLLGRSTHGLTQLVEQIFGGCLSRQTISRLMRRLDEQLVLWCNQPVEPIYPVAHIDGMHVDTVGSDWMVMLVVGHREDSVLEVLDFSVCRTEQCTELLQDLRRRGLEDVRMFVSDDSAAIRSALEQVYPLVGWRHCAFHLLSRLRATIGATDYRDRIVSEVACISRCETREAALNVAVAWRDRWGMPFALGGRAVLEGLRDSSRFYDLPKCSWKWVRTTNPLERLIRTLWQRLSPMGCFRD